MENDGSAFISEEGKEQAVDWLTQAFPGSDVHHYSDEEEDGGELDVAGKAPIFEIEFRWKGMGAGR